MTEPKLVYDSSNRPISVLAPLRASNVSAGTNIGVSSTTEDIVLRIVFTNGNGRYEVAIEPNEDNTVYLPQNVVEYIKIPAGYSFKNYDFTANVAGMQ